PRRPRGARLSPVSRDGSDQAGRGRGCVPRGARAHRRHRRAHRRCRLIRDDPSEQTMILGVPVSELLLLAALIIVAGFISGIVAVAPGAVLKLDYVLVANVIAVKLLVGRDSWQIADDLPGPAGMTAYGVFVGLAASLMGISGGSVSNLILTLYGKPIHKAVATSAGLGVPITVAGTIGYILAGLPQQSLLPPLSLGFVSLIGFALMAPVSSLTAPYGARLAHRLSKRRLEIAFGCFLLVACIRFAVSLIE